MSTPHHQRRALDDRPFGIHVALRTGTLLALVLPLLFGCNFPARETPGPSGLAGTATAERVTLEAKLTEVVGTLRVTVTPTGPPEEATAAGTATPGPTATLSPTSSATPSPCNRAEFVADVTVPDGSRFDPEERFTKTWKLRNTGTCDWTPGYALVFMKGERMSGESRIEMDDQVEPGESIDLSVELQAPEEVGKTRGYWALSDEDGEVFGIGPGGQGLFWVEIEVMPRRSRYYSFVDDYCDAVWESAAGVLPCPGDRDDARGYVLRLEEPVLEGGRTEDEPGLLTVPQVVQDGSIKGTFPVMEVEEGDQFRAIVSCLDGAPACNVRFRLDVQTVDGAQQRLGTWDEKSEGGFTRVVVGLDELEGSNVRFILMVLARGAPDQDAAFWLQPSIWRWPVPGIFE